MSFPLNLFKTIMNFITSRSYNLVAEGIDTGFSTNMKVYKSYPLPIVDYCSIIWNKSQTLHNLRIEPILRSVTRNTLNTPLRPISYRYMEYSNRLNSLRMASLKWRRICETIMFGSRIINNEIVTKDKCIFNEALYRRQRVTRNPALFDLRRALPGSTIYRIMDTMNKYRHLINLSTASQKVILRNSNT